MAHSTEQMIAALRQKLAAGQFFPELFKPGALVWYNFSEQQRPFSDAIEQASIAASIIPDLHAEDIRITQTDRGLLVQHVACCTLPDGSVARVPTCIVFIVEDGLITAADEYVTESRSAPIAEALQKAMEQKR